MCFSFIADQIARVKEKYQDVCKKRAEAGRKGGKQKQANLANAKNETLCKSNVADTDNDNENEHENDRNIYTKKIAHMLRKVQKALLEKAAFEITEFCELEG